MDDYGHFAFLYDPLITPVLRPVHRAILALFKRHHCTTVIDLCCGTGVLTEMANRAGLDATGVDLSPSMLAVARTRSARFIQADGTALPMPDNGFDGVSISFALHEKPQTVALDILAEAQRVIRPGGVIAVADYRQPERGTGRWTGHIINMVERLAGREHHTHFRRYMAIGGSDGFLRSAELPGRCTRTFMSGWAGLYEILS